MPTEPAPVALRSPCSGAPRQRDAVRHGGPDARLFAVRHYDVAPCADGAAGSWQ